MPYRPCDDPVYQHEFARMESFQDALIYTPGDNEWTDCHRPAAGAYDPLERLGFLRSVFFSEPTARWASESWTLSSRARSTPRTPGGSGGGSRSPPSTWSDRTTTGRPPPTRWATRPSSRPGTRPISTGWRRPSTSRPKTGPSAWSWLF